MEYKNEQFAICHTRYLYQIVRVIDVGEILEVRKLSYPYAIFTRLESKSFAFNDVTVHNFEHYFRLIDTKAAMYLLPIKQHKRINIFLRGDDWWDFINNIQPGQNVFYDFINERNEKIKKLCMIRHIGPIKEYNQPGNFVVLEFKVSKFGFIYLLVNSSYQHFCFIFRMEL